MDLEMSLGICYQNFAVKYNNYSGYDPKFSNDIFTSLLTLYLCLEPVGFSQSTTTFPHLQTPYFGKHT